MSVVVTEARRWVGTPYLHQGVAIGAGCDCLGLIRGVWRQVYGTEPETPPAYSADWSEPQREELLWAAATRHLREATDQPMAEGDVLLFRMREGAVAKHLGILSQTGDFSTFIHAYAGHGVIESPLSRPWLRRVVARFRFPDLPQSRVAGRQGQDTG